MEITPKKKLSQNETAIRVREYRKKHPQKLRERERASRERIKKEVLTYYGKGKLRCVLCGFNNIDALTLDHIDDNGAQERKELSGKNTGGKAGSGFYRYVKIQAFPSGFQTLCANCNMIKQIEKFRRERL